MSLIRETVAAIATPPGRGGIGIIRISGPLASNIYFSLTGKTPLPNTAVYTPFNNQESVVIDRGVALFFKGPNSFTGEDVMECQIHGSDVVLDMLLEEILVLGAKLAKPGEFTERAFINDKIDLLQAEAVADLIDSKSKKAARSALQSLEGVFSRQIEKISGRIIDARALLEATLDFPEEEDIKIDLTPVNKCIHQAVEATTELLKKAEAGEIFNRNLTIVIAGKPNVGKSSLLNYLSGQDTAIVSSQPGTTRDPVKHNVLINGIEITLIDTAGVRETTDIVEQEGVSRSHKMLKMADLVLYIIDSDQEEGLIDSWLPENANKLIVRNKIDLCKERKLMPDNIITVSTKTGEGMSLLVEQINTHLRATENEENLVLARKRHIDALKSAEDFLKQCLLAIENKNIQLEIVAELLRQTLECFDELTGKKTSDDILGEIFNRFCIGK